ncbi:Aste57867_10608 [Aphanomyces stellatus]|uniref:Aste57867_10608 protein n=1 Tax=Aphanomyces stellatus TaxID=120398 RepID=A0A485KQW9_9STRA|nr:hypothetical protein As57867_010568 [Aphanomyces stellatus]VFT87480.1 Aste57867_10608 [Aphanomyces stellatus]
MKNFAPPHMHVEVPDVIELLSTDDEEHGDENERTDGEDAFCDDDGDETIVAPPRLPRSSASPEIIDLLSDSSSSSSHAAIRSSPSLQSTSPRSEPERDPYSCLTRTQHPPRRRPRPASTRPASPIRDSCNLVCADPQTILLHLVRVARDEQASFSDYTFLPCDFVVPSTPPWPPSLRGTRIDVAAFRVAYRFGRLAPSVVTSLNALRFVWDDLEAFEWTIELLALRTYRALHGDLCVPDPFVVATTPDWPKDTWGLPLGQRCGALRAAKASLTSLELDQLDDLGFPWDANDVAWANRLKALAIFHQVHGHCRIPREFVVPANDSQWPQETWHKPLGWIAAALRQAISKLPWAQYEELTMLGFDWTEDGTGQKGPAVWRGAMRCKAAAASFATSTRLPATPKIAFRGGGGEGHYLGALSTPRFPMFQTHVDSIPWDEYGETV